MNDDLYTSAKLREQAARRLDGDTRLQRSVGVALDPADRSVLSFLDGTFDSGDLDLPTRWDATALGHAVQSALMSEMVDDALETGDAQRLAFASGISDDRLDGSNMIAHLKLSERLKNNDAPAFLLGLGNPNTGKTNFLLLLAELWLAANPDGTIITNCRSLDAARGSVEYLFGTQGLYNYITDHPDEPKFLFVDEGSTHFDARTNSYEVASQMTPLMKRFAKLSVDVFGTIGHTKKDVHPEIKRLTTTAYFKPEKKVVELYEGIKEDEFTDQLFAGPLEEVAPTTIGYDPDDWSPWNFDLNTDQIKEEH
jgi:hypothetical protein